MKHCDISPHFRSVLPLISLYICPFSPLTLPSHLFPKAQKSKSHVTAGTQWGVSKAHQCQAEHAGKADSSVTWGTMARNRAVGLSSKLRREERKKRHCLWEMQVLWRPTQKRDNMLETWAWRGLATTICSLAFPKLHQIFWVGHKAAKITNPQMALQGLEEITYSQPASPFHVLCSQFDVFCVEAQMLHHHQSPP